MSLPSGWITAIDALGVALLHFLWQGIVLALLYAVLRPLCTSVAARYRLGMATLLAMLIVPVWTVLRVWPASTEADTLFVSGAQSLAALAGQALPRTGMQDFLPWLVAAWLCGVLVLSARSVWQWRKLQRLLRGAQAVGEQWEARLAMWRERFGLRRPVRLLCSTRAITPMLIGWIKPAILLPASLLSGFPPQQVELILAHELAHVRRWDYLANLAQVVIETVLFYHPAVHWVSRQVRHAREECCDDLVLQASTSGSALTYARALAGLEELRLDLGTVTPALGADGGVLIDRIRRIVGVAAVAPPTPRSYLLPLLLAGAALATMAWQAQQRTADLAAAVESLSLHTLALVSGNPSLVMPATANITLSLPEVEPAAPSVVVPDTPLTRSEDAPLRIALPKVAVSAASIDTVANVQSHVAAPSADLAIEAPVMAAQPARIEPSQVVQPVYPARAMASGIQGEVELAYRVGKYGEVVGVRIVSARPSGVFEQAAKAAMGSWRFPAAAAGEQRTQRFVFALASPNDKCQTTTGTLICRRPSD
jgi:TonB family protein